MTLIVIIQCRQYLPTAQIGYYALFWKQCFWNFLLSNTCSSSQNISGLGNQYIFKIMKVTLTSITFEPFNLWRYIGFQLLKAALYRSHSNFKENSLRLFFCVKSQMIWKIMLKWLKIFFRCEYVMYLMARVRRQP